MEKKKIGIIGYGVVGKRRRKFIDEHPLLETVAISDVNLDPEKDQIVGVKIFKNHEDLLNEKLDAVFVSVPNYIAPEITIKALKKGIHVFCEKPPGRSVEDVLAVMDTEKVVPGIVLKYGFNHRYHDSIQDALKIIKSGELGKIINMQGVYGKGKIVNPEKSVWRSKREFAGGGILLDQGIHMVDLLRLFCGEFHEVHSFISDDFWEHDVEENAFAIMKDDNGVVASIHSSGTLWEHTFSLNIYLTKGYLKLFGILSGTRSYGEETLTIGKKTDSDQGSLEARIIKYLEDTSWQREINEFAEALIGKNSIKLGTSTDALNTMKLVYRIYYADSKWRNKYNIPNPD